MKRVSVILALLLLMLALSSSLAGCGSSDPKGVAQTFIESIVDNDNKTAIGLCANEEDGRAMVGLLNIGLADTEDKDFTYTAEEVNDNKTRVKVDSESGEFCSIELKLVDGEWKVDDLD